MSEEFHISSVVVTADPRRRAEVEPAITALGIADIAYSDPGGKMIVTLETENERDMVDALTAIQLMPGVASAALAYHHASQELGATPANNGESQT